jgi:hypothetical protein
MLLVCAICLIDGFPWRELQPESTLSARGGKKLNFSFIGKDEESVSVLSHTPILLVSVVVFTGSDIMPIGISVRVAILETALE